MTTYTGRCPACGHYANHCEGHDTDRLGSMILRFHNAGDHRACHPILTCGTEA